MAEVRVRVLGGLEIEGITGVDAASLGSRKARTLFKALALARGRAVTPDCLAEWLWLDEPPARPGEQVRVLVSRLRAVVGAERLVRTDAGYALKLDWLDLDALEAMVGEARRRLEAGSPGLARAAAASALMLVRGPLLPEEADAEWAEADRALAARLEGEARRVGAEAALAGGDRAGAALLAEGALDHDPYDEAVLRVLMSALAGSGRPASALAAYAAVRARLAEDLGVDPDPETEALHTAILLAPSPPADRTPPSAAPALPGRADALEALEAALGRAAGGHGGLVVVEGEGGMGKSRLLAVWAAGAADSGATVLSARCEELTRALPLQAVIDALDDRFHSLTRAEMNVVLDAEADLLGPLLAASAVGRDAPASPPAPPPSALRDQIGGQSMIFAALVNVLARMAPPVVLVMDDIHLAGATTIEWLQYAAHRAAHLPLLFVCAQRPEEATRIPAATSVRLAPLDVEAAVEVVGPERAAELWARSGGNPLFLVELAAADPAEGLPATVRDAVAARCERAGPAAAATLRTAALIGPVVDLDVLATVLRIPPAELLDHLEEGMRRGLLVEEAGAFAFRHDLIREALVAGSTASRRALVHRETGRALAGRARPDPVTVAYHARLGGDDEMAARALIDAAAIASSRFDHSEALRLLDESLGLDDTRAGRLARARVRIVLGQYAPAGADVEMAVAQGGRADALAIGAWAAYYRRDFPAALHLADDGVRVAETPDERVGCLTIGGWASQAAGDLPGAELRLEEANRLALGLWRPVSEVWLGGLRAHQGRSEEAVHLIRPATVHEAVGVHQHPALHAYLFLALALANLGRAEEALAAAASINAEAERTGAIRWAGRAENVRGWILRGLGDWPAADDSNRLGLELSSRIKMSEPVANAHLDLAAGALLAGDLDRASAEVEAAESMGIAHAMGWRHGLRARLYRGELALAAGDLALAQETAGALSADAERLGIARYAMLSGLLLARSRLGAGEAVDLDGVDRLLSGLAQVASMESWWLTAALASAAGVDRWWAQADAHVVRLAGHAGARSEAFQRAAGATLDRMRTVKRRG